jgi:hypothetical protein
MLPGSRLALGGGWVAVGLGPIVLYRRRARGDAEVPGNTKAAASPMTPIGHTGGRPEISPSRSSVELDCTKGLPSTSR